MVSKDLAINSKKPPLTLFKLPAQFTQNVFIDNWSYITNYQRGTTFHRVFLIICLLHIFAQVKPY